MPNATNTSAAPPGSRGRVAADPGCGVTAVLIAFVLFGSVDPVLLSVDGPARAPGGHHLIGVSPNGFSTRRALLDRPAADRPLTTVPNRNGGISR